MKSKKIYGSSLSIFLAACITISIYGDTISDLNKQSQDIQNKIDSAQSNLDSTQSQKQDALTEIAILDRELSECQAELDAIVAELEETVQRLDLTQEELEKAIYEKEEQYETLKKRIRVMYENGDVGYLEIILESESFSDFLDRIEYSNRLMDFDQKVLSDYQKIEEAIADSVQRIEEDKTNLEVLEEQQEEEKSKLNESIATKNQLVEKLNSDEATYKAQIADLEEQDADIQELIKKKQNEAAAAAKNSSSSSGYSTTYQSSNTIYASNGANFMYPVPAYSGYTPNSGYGYRSSPISGGSEFHTGLDLKATLNTDIVAAESGTVIFSGSKGGYGNTVIIDHGNGISTLYAHNNILCCNVGDTVSKGQVISKAGTTGYSTGVHLHFEVRINGAHTNPTPYIY